jgi:hypothetical protein
MTLYQRLIALAQAVGADVKQIFAKQGDLSQLNTTAKSNLVAAINEVLVEAQKSEIDDGVTSSTKTWSSQKISSTLSTAVQNAKDEILGELPPEALNTIKELADALQNNENFGAQVLNAIAGKVSFTEAQNLTEAQKQTARTNIGAVSAVDVANVTDALQAEVDGIDTRLVVAEGEIDTLQSQMTAAQQTIVTHTTDISELKSDVATLEATAVQTTSDLNALAATVAANKVANDATDAAQSASIAALDTAVDQRISAAKDDIRTNDIGTDVDLVAIYNAAKA